MAKLHQSTNYGPRGVIHGLEEGEERFGEIASSIGLKGLKKIGNPETSRTTMVTWPQGVEMSTHIKIGGGGILKSGPTSQDQDVATGAKHSAILHKAARKISYAAGAADRILT